MYEYSLVLKVLATYLRDLARSLNLLSVGCIVVYRGRNDGPHLFEMIELLLLDNAVINHNNNNDDQQYLYSTCHAIQRFYEPLQEELSK